MQRPDQPSIRLDVSFIKGTWQVVIFIGNQTEHRSFRTEAEAREYGKARLGQLISGKERARSKGPV